jgi:glutamyl-Q tRNA(Asp) synthetase
MTKPIYRFAPSPNGELHLGHAYSALFTSQAAHHAGGAFLLRIEDIDTLRCRPHFAAQIMEDLSWLGLRWEAPVRFQSQHLEDYAAAQARLNQAGLLYPCFCSRRSIAAFSPGRLDPDGNPLYPGICRKLSVAARLMRIARHEPFRLRIDMEEACRRIASPLSFHDQGRAKKIEVDPRRWGDVILVRKDIGTSYHIAVVVDDAIQAITHVTRGLDLFEATHIHRLLQELLDLPSPLYHHHPLISDEHGRKLAKSLADRSLRSLRRAGMSASTVRRALGFEN